MAWVQYFLKIFQIFALVFLCSPKHSGGLLNMLTLSNYKFRVVWMTQIDILFRPGFTKWEDWPKDVKWSVSTYRWKQENGLNYWEGRERVCLEKRIGLEIKSQRTPISKHWIERKELAKNIKEEWPREVGGRLEEWGLMGCNLGDSFNLEGVLIAVQCSWVIQKNDFQTVENMTFIKIQNPHKSKNLFNSLTKEEYNTILRLVQRRIWRPDI